MAASVKANETPDDLIAQAQEADFRPWEEIYGGGNTFRRRLFTWGLPIGPQPQRQPEKRVEQGGPGDFVCG